MIGSLGGRTALVTGGARDIGGAMSKALAAAGARVIINYFRAHEEAHDVASSIREGGGQACLCRADVTTSAGVATLARAVEACDGGRLDILVNNVGGLIGRRPIEKMDATFVDAVLRVNFTSTVLVTQALVGAMEKGGSIVNMASLAGRNGGAPGATIYAASKAAVMAYTRGLAKELGPRGIRVNCLCPGLINTRFHDMFSTDEERSRSHQMTPLRREGLPDEVAAATVFLAGNASSYLTGISLDVNGGLGFS